MAIIPRFPTATLALVGSIEAKYCAEAVDRLHDLTATTITAPVKGGEWSISKLAKSSSLKITLGTLLILEIRRARRGESPTVDTVQAVSGSAMAIVGMRSPEATLSEPFSEMVVFGGGAQSQTKREISIIMTDGVIKALADFLGPIEDSAE